MKSFMRSILLLFWLITVLAPSCVILRDTDKDVIILSINEEEQQEEGKKDQVEENVFTTTDYDVVFTAYFDNVSLNTFYLLSNTNPTMKILLQPPKFIS